MSSRFGSDPSKRDRPAIALTKTANTQIISFSSSLETLNDEELVAQLLAGNHDALTVLFEKYSGMVFSIARRMLKDEGESEETVQQVFLDMYRALDQFDSSKASYKTWLLQYAYHRAINRKHHLEAKGFYSLEELQDELLPSRGCEGAGNRLQLSSPDVVCLIKQILAKISDRQRRTIELTYFEGLTAEEISIQTGETPAVVRHNLYRGLDKLRSALLEHAQDRKDDTAQTEVEGMFFAKPRSL